MQIAQDPVQSALESLQRWILYNLSGKLVPYHDHPLSEKAFSYIYMEFAILQFLPIASCRGTGCCWQERDSICLTSPIRYWYTLIKSLWAHPSPAWGLLALSASACILKALCDVLQDSLQYVLVFLVLENPERDTGLQMCLIRDE